MTKMIARVKRDAHMYLQDGDGVTQTGHTLPERANITVVGEAMMELDGVPTLMVHYATNEGKKMFVRRDSLDSLREKQEARSWRESMSV